MGRKEKSQVAQATVTAETDLRRSTRKRKLKKESDVDFDYDYHCAQEENSQKIETPRDPKERRESITPSPSFSGNAFFDSSPYSFSFSPLPSPSPSSKQKSDLNINSMNARDIINAHCKNLEARLQRVASDYVPTWQDSIVSSSLSGEQRDADIVEGILEKLVGSISSIPN